MSVDLRSSATQHSTAQLNLETADIGVGAWACLLIRGIIGNPAQPRTFPIRHEYRAKRRRQLAVAEHVTHSERMQSAPPHLRAASAGAKAFDQDG